MYVHRGELDYITTGVGCFFDLGKKLKGGGELYFFFTQQQQQQQHGRERERKREKIYTHSTARQGGHIIRLDARQSAFSFRYRPCELSRELDELRYVQWETRHSSIHLAPPTLYTFLFYFWLYRPFLHFAGCIIVDIKVDMRIL